MPNKNPQMKPAVIDRHDPRYVQRDHPDARFTARGEPDETLDLGAWTGDDPDEFLTAVRDELDYAAHGQPTVLSIYDRKNDRVRLELVGQKFKIASEDLPPVNSGALVQAIRISNRTLSARIVEASAHSHIAPRYRRASEAPRVYGRITSSARRRAWLRWFARVLSGGSHYDESEALRVIARRYDELPVIDR